MPKSKQWLLGIILCLVLFFAISALLFFRVYRIDGKTSFEIGRPSDSLLVQKTVFFLKRNVPFFKKAGFAKENEKIGWVSDIHADRFKRRDINSGLMFPRRYSDYLPKVFDELRRLGIDTVIATGDNTNSGDDNYARALKHIAEEKHMRVIWVRGNHDNEKVMSILGAPEKSYYYIDYGETRIIVLDDVESNGDYQGTIDPTQLDWLKDALHTPKQVIIAMHIPIFDGGLSSDNVHDFTGNDFPFVGGLLPRYAELENILRSSGNVKLVLSGHWHVPWQKEYNGIRYAGEAALTRTGYFGAYGVIDLKNDSMENFSAEKN
ncbi:MAG: metallophosphoesterase [Parcubacteria group bacterium]